MLTLTIDWLRWARSFFISLMLRWWSARFFHFVAVGLACMALHSGVFLLCYDVLDMHRQWAYAIGAGFGYVANFTLNKYVVYKSRANRDAPLQVLKYGVKKFVFYLLGALLLELGVEYFGYRTEFVQPTVVAILGIPSFFVLRKYVFQTSGR